MAQVLRSRIFEIEDKSDDIVIATAAIRRISATLPSKDSQEFSKLLAELSSTNKKLDVLITRLKNQYE